jgi:hypothetical protein
MSTNALCPVSGSSLERLLPHCAKSSRTAIYPTETAQIIAQSEGPGNSGTARLARIVHGTQRVPQLRFRRCNSPTPTVAIRGEDIGLVRQ